MFDINEELDQVLGTSDSWPQNVVVLDNVQEGESRTVGGYVEKDMQSGASGKITFKILPEEVEVIENMSNIDITEMLEDASITYENKPYELPLKINGIDETKTPIELTGWKVESVQNNGMVTAYFQITWDYSVSSEPDTEEDGEFGPQREDYGPVAGTSYGI
jgi:hypothetical protein